MITPVSKTLPLVRPLTREETHIMFDWVKQEGWNPGINDAETLYQFFPAGLLGCFIDNQLAGVSAVFNYSPGFAFFGLYIIKPEYRGLGYGLAITRHRLQIAGQRNIGLDGVMENISKYRHIGFRFAYTTFRFEFRPIITPPTPPQLIANFEAIPLADLLDYEARLFPASRSSFLKVWLAQPHTIKAAWLLNNQLQGYGVMRHCINGYKVGPLFADSPEIAEQLLFYFLSKSQGQRVFLDTPELNEAALRIGAKLKAKEVFKAARMYTGYIPNLDYQRIYSITSLETG